MQRTKLVTQIDDSGLKTFERALDGTLDDAKRGFNDLYANVKKVGAADSLLRGLKTLNAALDKTLAHRESLRGRLGAPTDRTTTAYERLEQVQSDRASPVGSVAATGRGVFDVSSTRGPDDTAPTGGSMEANALQAANLIERFYNGIRTLAASALGKSATGAGMLRQLIEQGPGAYPQVQALLKDTPAQLQGLIGAQGRINTASARLGAFAGTTFFGAQETSARKTVTDLRARIAEDDRRAKRQGDVIAAAVERALKNVKQDIYIDGKKAGSATKSGNKKKDRRK